MTAMNLSPVVWAVLGASVAMLLTMTAGAWAWASSAGVRRGAAGCDEHGSGSPGFRSCPGGFGHHGAGRRLRSSGASTGEELRCSGR